MDCALSPPSRRSPLGSPKAALSPLVANWSASSPRAAFSRVRKSSVEGSAEAALTSVCAGKSVVSYAGGGFVCWNLPPESKSSREGNRSAILYVARIESPGVKTEVVLQVGGQCEGKGRFDDAAGTAPTIRRQHPPASATLLSGICRAVKTAKPPCTCKRQTSNCIYPAIPVNLPC